MAIRAIYIKAIRGKTLPRGRALSMGELAALLEQCAQGPGPAGARDAAVIALLARAGLRRSEAVALDLTDYDPETGAITIRSGKGNKDRITYVDGGSAAAIDDWLDIRGPSAGPLLCYIHKNGAIHLRRLTNQAILWILQKRADTAHVSRFTPHDLRRTFISDLIDAGADISAVQKLAGHEKTDTTIRYDRRGEAAKKRAVTLLHLPYRSRAEQRTP